MKRLLAIAVVCSITAMAGAAIVAVDAGTAWPRPTTLGPYSIEPLPYDGRSTYTDVYDAPGDPPLTGDLGFGTACSLRRIGSGWMTWSGSYTGVVYFSNYLTSVTQTLPTGTAAFLQYIEPNPFDFYDITATAQDGTSLTVSVTGSYGASGFGFYGTDGDTIETVTIRSTADFAFGEFFGAVPEPGSLSLLGLAGLYLLRRR